MNRYSIEYTGDKEIILIERSNDDGKAGNGN